MTDYVEMFIGLIGGLGLFLYGMKLMGDGLENAAGEKLKAFFEKITSNPIKSVFLGMIVTAVIQSSSATTVMVIGFVNAGLMDLYQAAGVIMGANIGTTITAQLVAFKLDTIAPIFVGIGAFVYLFSKSKKSKEISSIILGFGILFVGMSSMSKAMVPLSESPVFRNLISVIGNNWALGIVVGLVITSILQSSSAVTGILVALASSGVITMNVAVPILFGSNIGTCVTALISSIGTNKTAKRAALIHLIFNVVGTLIFIPLIGVLIKIVGNISPGNIERQIANAHTIFNILNTIVMLPCIKLLVTLVQKIIPGEQECEVMGVKFIDERLLETPVIAVGQTIKEIVRMANKAEENVELSMHSFFNNNKEEINKVIENEKLINILNKDIVAYLVKLSNTEISPEQRNIVTSMFHVVNDLERIGDHAKNLSDLSYEKINKGIIFSNEATNNLKEMYSYVLHNLKVSIEAFETNDMDRAQSVMAVEEKIDIMEEDLRESNIKRLNNGNCSPNCSAIFLDMISNFERVGDHSVNIAEVVMNR